MPEKKRAILLVDGHSLAYRAFFALPDTMSTTGGQPTNAVYGFTTMLFKAIEQQNPDAVLVAFDGPRSELKRTEEFPEYKAHRPTMPDELRSQMEMIDQLLETMKIPRIRVQGYEADDILGTIARTASDSGDLVTIVTGDRDTLQLVGEGVTVMLTSKGITETDIYDEEAVQKRYGISPDRLPDMTGLKGDKTDNIPGVPGIGEKGALSLIKEYGSLDGLYEKLDEISGPKRKQSLEDNRDAAYLSRHLAVIDTEVPIETDVSAVELGEWSTQDVLDYLSALEFKLLVRRFVDLFGTESGAPATPSGEDIQYSIVDVEDEDALKTFEDDILEAGSMAVSVSATGTGYCEIGLERLALAGNERLLLVDPDVDCPASKTARRLLQSPVEKSFHDAKTALEALDKIGWSVENLAFDTEIAAYLENPSLGSYYLWNIWEKCVDSGLCIEGKAETITEQESLLPGDSLEEDLKLASDAARIFHLRPALAQRLEDCGMAELFEEVEMPLVTVLKDMEEAGVAVDTDVFDELADEAGKALSDIEETVFELAGHEFNIGSTKQLAKVLFEDLGLTPIKRTKTGYSTDSSVLEALREEHPIAAKLIEYREYSKLKSTYFDVLPALVCAETGKIHCCLNQTKTTTGRISSSNPNLQNIPIRTEVGRRIRAGFVPGTPGWKMLVADYSQIELRVLAHMSEDPLLVEAFNEGVDIHRRTAADLFGVGPDEVSPEMRRVAKMVNFGVVYGMGYFGLSSRLGISREEAASFIDTYFARYAGVREYRDRCISDATEKGYAETLLGRRRYINQLASRSRQTRELGERLAINTPIQGTAADIIKKAMVDVSRALADSKLDTGMTLQIHDELIFDVPPGEVDELKEMVIELMSGVLQMSVPLVVDICACNNWGEAK